MTETEYKSEADSARFLMKGIKANLKKQAQKASIAQKEVLLNLSSAVHLQDVQAELNNYNYYRGLVSQLNALLDEI